MHKYVIVCISFLFISCTNSENKSNKNTTIWKKNYQAISKLGDTLYSKAPSDKIKQEYRTKKAAFEENADLENTIWYGRFAAYTGDYRKAIAIYSNGLEKFPNESRLLRHRGHRYISVREFDNAIADLEKAAQLIEGEENKVEEDGMPNAQNIPVSTMHGNIYYHLGLAYYLSGDDTKAVNAYKKCLQTSHNPDNLVSATHWLYTINCQMGNMEQANTSLEKINAEITVIENDAYLKACLLYKGEIKPNTLQEDTEDSPSNSALAYGIANYVLCQGDSENAKRMLTTIVSGTDWASFGYIAAEVDLANKF